MSQKIFADLNRLAHRRSCHFCFVIFHISTVQQSRNPEYGTDIFACPIGNCLSLANQKLLMFLKVIGHQVKGFFGKVYRLGISSNRQSHQAKNQAAISGGYFGRNRLGTKDPAANSGRWGRIQEA